MKSFFREKLACAYYFAFNGLAYGIFTGRMPALKAQVGADDAQIGFLLLAFGSASFCGLLGSGWGINKFGARLLTGLAPIWFTIMFSIMAFCANYYCMLGFAMLAGFGMGLCDVAMNAMGVYIESRHHIRSMGFFHAIFSLGGVTGAVCGSLFAALSLSTFINFCIILGLYCLLWPWAYYHLNRPPSEKKATRDKGGITLFVIICGLLSLCCYVSEGSVGEWGSILLHSAKGASQQEAALTFAAFSTSMVICRFNADRLRCLMGDFTLVLFGGFLGAIAMAVVLLSPWPVVCLIAYGFMGIGFAPIVPILYSRVGQTKGVSPARAIWTMSMLSYSGLLFFPAFLGILAEKYGLDKTLWIIVSACVCVAIGSLALKNGNRTVS